VSFLREEGRVIVDVPEWLVALSVVGLGLLMVARSRIAAARSSTCATRSARSCSSVIALLLVIVEHSVTLFAIGVAYVLSGPVDWLWRRHTGRAARRGNDAGTRARPRSRRARLTR
jgi:phosphatidylserine synthase